MKMEKLSAEEKTLSSYLRAVCLKRIPERYPDNGKVAQDRLEEEMALIEENAFCDYFLILGDIAKYTKDNCMAVGSYAVGSIVCYLLGITDLDPLRFNLLFERFLYSNDLHVPPVGILLSQINRDRVIEYVIQTYCKEIAATINLDPALSSVTLSAKKYVICYREGELITGCEFELWEQGRRMSMYFEGHNALTLIEETIKNIKHNRNITIDPRIFDLNDAKTFALLSQGNTEGIFEGDDADLTPLYRPVIS